MIAGSYNLRTREVGLVNAGHLPEILLGRDRWIHILEGGEQLLGILPDCRFSLSEPIKLQGGALYLYSDGVTETKTADGGMLAREGLIRLLQQYRHKLPMLRLRAVVEAIRPQQRLHDDITLLMISGD